jgi:hypothetical protein
MMSDNDPQAEIRRLQEELARLQAQLATQSSVKTEGGIVTGKIEAQGNLALRDLTVINNRYEGPTPQDTAQARGLSSQRRHRPWLPGGVHLCFLILRSSHARGGQPCPPLPSHAHAISSLASSTGTMHGASVR